MTRALPRRDGLQTRVGAAKPHAQVGRGMCANYPLLLAMFAQPANASCTLLVKARSAVGSVGLLRRAHCASCALPLGAAVVVVGPSPCLCVSPRAATLDVGRAVYWCTSTTSSHLYNQASSNQVTPLPTTAGAFAGVAGLWLVEGAGRSGLGCRRQRPGAWLPPAVGNSRQSCRGAGGARVCALTLAPPAPWCWCQLAGRMGGGGQQLAHQQHLWDRCPWEGRREEGRGRNLH